MKYNYDDAVTIITEINKCTNKLSAWEVAFIKSILRYKQALTDKQSSCLFNIYAKITGGGIYEDKEYINRKEQP